MHTSYEDKTSKIIADRELLVRASLPTLMCLSRTMQGQSDVSVSPLKLSLKKSGEELVLCAKDNFASAVLRFAILPPRDLFSGKDVASAITRLAQGLNLGLADPTAPLFRQWEMPFSQAVRCSQVEDAFHSFCGELADRLAQRERDPIAIAAWAERTLNIFIHPFYDGSGRASQALGVGILARHGLRYPQFPSATEYYREIVKSSEEWENYYRSKIVSAD